MPPVSGIGAETTVTANSSGVSRQSATCGKPGSGPAGSATVTLKPWDWRNSVNQRPILPLPPMTRAGLPEPWPSARTRACSWLASEDRISRLSSASARAGDTPRLAGQRPGPVEHLLLPAEVPGGPTRGPLQGTDFAREALPFGHELQDLAVDGRQLVAKLFQIHGAGESTRSARPLTGKGLRRRAGRPTVGILYRVVARWGPESGAIQRGLTSREPGGPWCCRGQKPRQCWDSSRIGQFLPRPRSADWQSGFLTIGREMTSQVRPLISHQGTVRSGVFAVLARDLLIDPAHKKGLCAARKESSTSVTRHRSQKKPTRRRTNQQLEVEAAKTTRTTNHHRLTHAPRPDSRQQQKPV